MLGQGAGQASSQQVALRLIMRTGHENMCLILFVDLAPVVPTADAHPAGFGAGRCQSCGVSHLVRQERLREAQQHGFKKAMIPCANSPKQHQDGMEIFAAKNLSDAIKSLGFGQCTND